MVGAFPRCMSRTRKGWDKCVQRTHPPEYKREAGDRFRSVKSSWERTQLLGKPRARGVAADRPGGAQTPGRDLTGGDGGGTCGLSPAAAPPATDTYRKLRGAARGKRPFWARPAGAAQGSSGGGAAAPSGARRDPRLPGRARLSRPEAPRPLRERGGA